MNHGGIGLDWKRASCVVLFSLVLGAHVLAQGGVAPKILFDPSSPDAATQAQLERGKEAQVSTSLDKSSLTVTIKAGPIAYPGIIIKPAGGLPWNLGSYGHVEAKVTNVGSKRIDLNLRVDNEGDYTKNPWNGESKVFEPGQTKTIRVYFGYSYGFKPGFILNPGAITQLLFFTGKASEDISFRIESVEGAGWVGEKIGIDPDRVAIKPPGGVLLDDKAMIQPGPQIGTTGGANGIVGADGKLLQIDFNGAQVQSVTFRPAHGLWNLNEAVEVRVKLRNIGQTPVTPSARVESERGPTEVASAAAPLAAGEAGEIVIPFAAKVPWNCVVDPAQLVPKTKGTWGARPGTGTPFVSNFASGITFLPDKSVGAQSLLVTSIVADLPPQILPAWLGQKPPVDGDWAQTLNENFDGNAINPRLWNVHAANWWDKRMHFSKDGVIVQDGELHLRLEKKTGYQNDDPAPDREFQGAYSGAQSDYSAGNVDTFGKWTQRYGYFEIREKQPTAKCLWPGLWMMPDRGLKFAKDHGWKSSAWNPSLPWANVQDNCVLRGSTGDGGMEFDITESQSAWGIHRFNIACHWDGYEGGHKALGTSTNYVQADKDGFIVVGLLWTPGSYVVYGNGKEIFHWESPRISDQEEILILQNQIGGWDNEPVDDAQLPADFIVDYIRVWQRKDLASPDDGPKPNKGDLDAFHEDLP